MLNLFRFEIIIKSVYKKNRSHIISDKFCFLYAHSKKSIIKYFNVFNREFIDAFHFLIAWRAHGI